KLPIEEIVADPVSRVRRLPTKPHPRIPLPKDLYGAERRNSAGVDLTDTDRLQALAEAMQRSNPGSWWAAPLIGGAAAAGKSRNLSDPADRRRKIGEVAEADAAAVDQALSRAVRAQHQWSAGAAEARADCLNQAADLMEQDGPALMAMAIREAGKTLPD